MTPPICIDIPKQILFAMVTLPDLAPLLIMVILCARQFLCPFLCLRGCLKIKSARLFAVEPAVRELRDRLRNLVGRLLLRLKLILFPFSL